MVCIENPNTDPYVNHALEEWLISRFDEDCFMLWRNQKSILLGKNQNIYHELNLPYIKERQIKIVRRITGGGAVFTDEGNLMFTFTSCGGRRDFTDFYKFAEPVLSALRALGVPAAFTGRNDMVIQGAKFSGNAQCLWGGKLLHHGTLLYHADTSEMAKALRVSPLKLRDKGVSSVASRVTNIRAHLIAAGTDAAADVLNIDGFQDYLSGYIIKNSRDARVYRLSAEEWDEVKKIAARKYASPAWIYGRNPVFNVQTETKFTGGILQVYGHVVKGRLAHIRICGDFFGDEDIGTLEANLVGVAYEADALKNALAHLPVGAYIGHMTADELVGAIIGC